MLLAPLLTPAGTQILVLLPASVERFGVSCMRDFFYLQFTKYTKKCIISLYNFNWPYQNIHGETALCVKLVPQNNTSYFFFSLFGLFCP